VRALLRQSRQKVKSAAATARNAAAAAADAAEGGSDPAQGSTPPAAHWLPARWIRVQEHPTSRFMRDGAPKTPSQCAGLNREGRCSSCCWRSARLQTRLTGMLKIPITHLARTERRGRATEQRTADGREGSSTQPRGRGMGQKFA